MKIGGIIVNIFQLLFSLSIIVIVLLVYNNKIGCSYVGAAFGRPRFYVRQQYIRPTDGINKWRSWFMSSIGTIILNILQVLFSISIIITVLLQSGKSAGISGSIAGGAETFFGKSKGRTIDAMLSKYTSFASIAFLITSIILFIFLKRAQM